MNESASASAAPHPNALLPGQLARRTDPGSLELDLAVDRPPVGADQELRPAHLVGHERAARAIDFALNVGRPGYNLFVMGPMGIGKTRFLREAVSRRNRRVKPVDQIYLNNFSDDGKPVAATLGAGEGARLRAAMLAMIQDLRTTIQAAFDAESYLARIEKFKQLVMSFEHSGLEAVQEEVKAEGLALAQSPDGLVVTPMDGAEPMTPEALAKLTEADQKRLRERLVFWNDRLERLNRDSLKFRRDQAAKLRGFNRETALAAVKPNVDELRSAFGHYPDLVSWFNALQDDLLDRYQAFLPAPDDTEPEQMLVDPEQLGRYDINVLTESPAADDAAAPVIQLDHPTVPELLGRIESRIVSNAVQTDFRMIRPGALHRANGGYLLIDAWRLFSEPRAWDALKRALQRRAIRIETMAETATGVSAGLIEPDPIPLDVKVILFGERESYYTLSELDPEFDALFRITADFDDNLERTTEHQNGLAVVLAEQADANDLLALDRSALARLLDEAARCAEDQNRLSAHVQYLTEVAVEADYEARQQGVSTINEDHIASALANRKDRASRAHLEHQRSILEQTILIATEGYAIGQVNGLAVYDIGGEAFGHPSRISASTRLGDGQVLDIQRETHMGGAIHTKGVMTLSAYFGARYAPRHPLPVNASLVFEQSYGPVDGDSATLAELCALISSISLVPVRQDLAITGSMNQLGEAQAIGGVNDKIEGFYQICRERGLTGTQGVILPVSNVSHLMLDDEIIDAVRRGMFHLYAVSHADEAIELLLNLPAGSVSDSAAQQTVSGLVALRLTDLLSQRNGGRAAARRARYGGGDRD
ncbi:MAG: Lon protease family protein [Burkholderiaceae bacterium]